MLEKRKGGRAKQPSIDMKFSGRVFGNWELGMAKKVAVVLVLVRGSVLGAWSRDPAKATPKNWDQDRGDIRGPTHPHLAAFFFLKKR